MNEGLFKTLHPLHPAAVDEFDIEEKTSLPTVVASSFRSVAKFFGRHRSPKSNKPQQTFEGKMFRMRRLLSLRTRLAKVDCTDPYGETWLHVLIDERNVDADAVRRALEARGPEAASQLTRFNHTCLHYACLPNRDVDVGLVKVLLDVNASAALSFDNLWRLPLHHIVQNDRPAAVDVIRCLVGIAPSTLSHRDLNGKTPIDLAWRGAVSRKFEESVAVLRKVGLASIPGRGEEGHLQAMAWAKMCIMIRASYYHQAASSVDGSESLTPILHSCVGTGSSCPPSFLELVMALCPEQAGLRDVNGDTPLHIAVGMIGTQLRPPLLKLLLLSPQAAKLRDGEERLPLTVAIAHGHNYERCIKPMLLVAPETRQFRDPKTRLYPFMLAASSEGRSNVDTAYQLLRADPSLVRRAL